MELTFSKMHGLGNDFVVIEDLEGTLDIDESAVVWMCDRHFGIGADGVILVRRGEVPGAYLQMVYFNADGSLAEMCGNGARCFAKYAVDHGLVAPDDSRLVVQTLGGLRPISFTRGADGTLASATVDMGEPILSPDAIPTTFDGEMVYECPVETPVGTFRVTAVSMGNPHAVIWVDDVDDAPVTTAGPVIETHERFPQRTNVEFAELVNDARIKVRVWERGVGETLACGTGACAVLVAASLSCRTGREASIELPGGELHVRWAEDGHIHLTGGATEVFTGTLVVPEES